MSGTAIRGLLAKPWAALLLAAVLPAKAQSLPALAADIDRVTVSGISSGGYMAVQYHFAHSDTVSGAGVLAGGPYECAAGSTWTALTRCMSPGGFTPLPPTTVFRARAERRALEGEIDPLSGLATDRVWIFSGDRDETVARPVVDALAALYRHWLPDHQLRFATRADAGHAMISTEEPAANACGSSEPPFINRCGDFDAAGELLTHLLGPLAAKQEPPPERIQAFDQTPFLGKNAAASGMAELGYVFVPSTCLGGGCAVHVAFHGCRQTTEQIGTRFVTNAGYVEWAQSNRLIVLFPQVVPRYGWTGGFSWVFNPRGCWDWWGYTDGDYATRRGRQIRAVHEMVQRVGAAPG